MTLPLFKLIEEAGEVMQVCGKLLQCPDGKYYNAKGDLYEQLNDELADLLAAMHFVMERYPSLDINEFNNRYNRKLKRLMGE